MLGNANQNENKSNYTEPSNKLKTDKKPAEKEFSAPGDEDDLPF